MKIILLFLFLLVLFSYGCSDRLIQIKDTLTILINDQTGVPLTINTKPSNAKVFIWISKPNLKYRNLEKKEWYKLPKSLSGINLSEEMFIGHTPLKKKLRIQLNQLKKNEHIEINLLIAKDGFVAEEKTFQLSEVMKLNKLFLDLKLTNLNDIDIDFYM